MTKESIHLIKGYVGHDVKCWYKLNPDYEGNVSYECKESIVDFDGGFADYLLEGVEYVKPILRPIEDLTDEEIKGLWYEMPVYIDNMSYKKEVTLQHLYDNIQSLDYRTMEYLNKLHIDYFGLIGQGLAVKKEK